MTRDELTVSMLHSLGGNMASYKVTWEIELDASSAFDAASQALSIQRDDQSIATVFDVERLGRKDSRYTYRVDHMDGSVTRMDTGFKTAS